MRIAHTMLRVGDQQKSIEFYTQVLGMQVLRQSEYPDGRFTNTFIGFDGDTGATIELTYNWDTDSYDTGTGFGHIAIEVDDVYAATDAVRERGGKIIREAGPMNAGTRIIAFIEDPDGYEIELIGAD